MDYMQTKQKLGGTWQWQVATLNMSFQLTKIPRQRSSFAETINSKEIKFQVVPQTVKIISAAAVFKAPIAFLEKWI